MTSHPLVYHASSTDFDQTAEMRLLVQQARELLKLPRPDTFLGRRTFEPFPRDDEQAPERH